MQGEPSITCFPSHFFLQTTPNFALNWQTSSSRVAPATLVVWWTTLSLSQRRVWACSLRQVIKNYIAGNTFNSIYVWAERKSSSRENSKIIHKHPVCSIWPFLIFFSFLHICKKKKKTHFRIKIRSQYPKGDQFKLWRWFKNQPQKNTMKV